MIDRLTMVACGTGLLRLPGGEILVRADRAHAGRSRCGIRIPLPRATGFTKYNGASCVSQSGETADTLAALRYMEGKAPSRSSVW